MSRNFCRDELTPVDSSSHSYKGAGPYHEVSLAREIVEMNWADNEISSREAFKDWVDHLLEPMRDVGGFDGQFLLDELVLEMESLSLSREVSPNSLMTLVMNSLYEGFGMREFTVDYRRFTCVQQSTNELRAAEDPLRVTYRLPEASSYVAYPTESLGSGAHNVLFYIEGPVRSLSGSRQCSFSMQVPPYHIRPGEDCKFYLLGAEQIGFKSPTIYDEHSFHMRTADGDFEVLVPIGSWADSILFIPDSAGGWQEVRPE